MVFGYLVCNCINERRALLTTIENIDNNRLDLSEPILIKTLLFGSDSFYANANTNVLNATIEYIPFTKRFEETLFQWSQELFKQGYESVTSVSILIATCLFLLLFVDFDSDFLMILFIILGYFYSFRYLVIVFLIWQCMI